MYRNTINNGYLIITCSERGNECSHWDSLKKSSWYIFFGKKMFVMV